MPGGNRKYGRLALGLGCFSIGLGLLQIAAPRRVARLTGTRNRPRLLRLLGFREVATGVGILMQHKRPGWLRARVAGDAIDLALLAGAFTSNRSSAVKLAGATAAVAGVTALDILCERKLSRASNGGAVHIKRVITIDAPAQELYRMWRNLEQLPTFMTHLESVRVLDDRRSHWVAKGPMGKQVEWDAEITEDLPGERIAWRSLEGADVDNSGSVTFQPATGKRGTVVAVELSYTPPAGKVGATVAKFTGQAPEKQILLDLMRLKQRLEAGEIARTEGQPSGRPGNAQSKFDVVVRS